MRAASSATVCALTKGFVACSDPTVVGVVGDVHHRGPGTTPGSEMYIPFPQFSGRQAIVVLRTAGDPARATSGPPGAAAAARFTNPWGIKYNSYTGTFLIADQGNNSIRLMKSNTIN